MKIGIVGAGYVGSTAAYSLALQGVGSELVLVDRNTALARAQAMDIMHATPFSHPVRVRAGDFPQLADCAIVILTAGAAQAPGETRPQLLARNAAVFSDVVPQVVRHTPDAILLVATNPLDVMTEIATRIAGFPSSRVLGSGTVLDTARFRALLAETYAVSPDSVHAYVLGEHGDSEVLAWSGAQIAGMPLAQFAQQSGQGLTGEMIARIDEGVRRAAYQIIDGKGTTCYGIGAALARIAHCILFDERKIFTACTLTRGMDDLHEVALSLPLVIGRDGVQMQLRPLLDAREEQALRDSAASIRRLVTAAGF